MSDLRRLAWLIAAAALVPLMMFWIIEGLFKAREERRAIEARALATSETLQYRVDGVIARHLAGLTALATTASLRSGDRSAFRARAAQLITLNPGWVAVSLIDAGTGAPLAEIGPGSRSVMLAPRTTSNQPPYLAGYARGAGCPCLVFTRAATLADTPVTVRLFVSNREIADMLPPSDDDYAVIAVVAPDGRFIARSLDGDRRFGTLGSTYLRVAARSHASSGLYRGFTLEGMENYTAYSRSPNSGWSSHVALKAHPIDLRARRFFQSLGLAAVLSLLLATILIWFALRQVAERRRIG